MLLIAIVVMLDTDLSAELDKERQGKAIVTTKLIPETGHFCNEKWSFIRCYCPELASLRGHLVNYRNILY